MVLLVTRFWLVRVAGTLGLPFLAPDPAASFVPLASPVAAIAPFDVSLHSAHYFVRFAARVMRSLLGLKGPVGRG
jgi:hypothetical protein